MLCEHANPQLVEYAAKELAADTQLAIEEHLSFCDTCQTDYAAIVQWSTMANSWHDELPPPWQPLPLHREGQFGTKSATSHPWLDNFRLWFPTAASTAALAMVALMFMQTPQTNGTLPTNQQTAADFSNLPQLPQAQQAAQKAEIVQSVMEGSREQRQVELQALLKILKAEMDRRSIETEESLRFVISHQLQGQEELDELYRQVEAIMLNPDQTNNNPTRTSGDVSP